MAMCDKIPESTSSAEFLIYVGQVGEIAQEGPGQ